MKILVFSDSHGSVSAMEKAISDNLSADVIDRIFFLGDGIRDFNKIKELYPNLSFDSVLGNCDGFLPSALFSEYVKIVKCCGITFMLTHGHMFNMKLTYESAVDYAAVNGVDIVLFGHTHRAEDTNEISSFESKKIRLINPGGIGNTYRASYAVLNIINGNVICGFGKV